MLGAYCAAISSKTGTMYSLKRAGSSLIGKWPRPSIFW